MARAGLAELMTGLPDPVQALIKREIVNVEVCTLARRCPASACEPVQPWHEVALDANDYARMMAMLQTDSYLSIRIPKCTLAHT